MMIRAEYDVVTTQYADWDSLPPSSSRLSRGYDSALRGALPPLDLPRVVGEYGAVSRWRLLGHQRGAPGP